MDESGALWVALFGGSRVACWDPESGKLLAQVRLPVSNVTSCAFGGRDLDELYITTARILLTEQELAKQPEAGGLFVVRPGVSGIPAVPFAG